jgi:hypothetical protein
MDDKKEKASSDLFIRKEALSDTKAAGEAPYAATNSDLPSILLDAPVNRVREAEDNILRCAGEMGIPVSFGELEQFALILVGLIDEAQIKPLDRDK